MENALREKNWNQKFKTENKKTQKNNNNKNKTTKKQNNTKQHKGKKIKVLTPKIIRIHNKQT